MANTKPNPGPRHLGELSLLVGIVGLGKKQSNTGEVWSFGVSGKHGPHRFDTQNHFHPKGIQNGWSKKRYPKDGSPGQPET